MCCRYNALSDIETILDNGFTELVICGLSCLFLAASFFNTVNTVEGNGNS